MTLQQTPLCMGTCTGIYRGEIFLWAHIHFHWHFFYFFLMKLYKNVSAIQRRALWNWNKKTISTNLEKHQIFLFPFCRYNHIVREDTTKWERWLTENFQPLIAGISKTDNQKLIISPVDEHGPSLWLSRLLCQLYCCGSHGTWARKHQL